MHVSGSAVAIPYLSVEVHGIGIPLTSEATCEGAAPALCSRCTCTQLRHGLWDQQLLSTHLLQDYVVHSTLRNVLRALIVVGVLAAVITFTGE